MGSSRPPSARPEAIRGSLPCAPFSSSSPASSTSPRSTPMRHNPLKFQKSRSIEVIFGSNVSLAGNLKAVIVPHTLWGNIVKAPWLDSLHTAGIQIEPYLFVPNRHPEHYHAQLEASVRKLYVDWGIDVA